MTYAEVKEVVESQGSKLLSKSYVNTTTPLSIRCRCKEPFKKTMKIMKKSGLYMCNKCVIKMLTERQKAPYNEVSEKLQKLGYSLLTTKSEYRGIRYKCLVECKNKHKRYQIPQDIFLGHGCKICASLKNGEKAAHSFEYVKEYIESFGYRLLSKEYEYQNTKSFIKVQCNKNHSEYPVTFDNFRGGSRCPYCYNEIRGRATLISYRERCEYVESFGYSIVTPEEKYIDASQIIEVRCDKGHTYLTNMHGFKSGYRCTTCNISKGEMSIKRFLEGSNINFINQYRFENCRIHRPLPFDFYLPDYNILVEYDGRQHFEIVKAFGGFDGFISTKISDTVKNYYCKNNDIKLIRIPYWDFDSIEEILKKELKL